MFQLLDHDRHFAYGDALYCAEANGLVNGNLVWISATGQVKKTAAGSAPHIDGFAYSRRTNTYRPTDTTIPNAEKMTVIEGAGRALMSADLFTEGSIPAARARVFGGAGGLLTVTADSNQAVGRCQRQVPVNDFIGIGTFTNMAEIEFLFTPLT